jgi:hypothetical protein
MSLRASLLLVAALLLPIAARAEQPNDNFANRIPVEPGAPFDASVRGATFETFDPLPAYVFPIGGQTNGSVWWTWTPQATGFASIIDMKDDYPLRGGFNALAVYDGDDLASLHDPVWMYANPIYGSGGAKAFLGFTTTAGRTRSIGMVGEATRDFGHRFLITFSETPIIVEEPASQTNFAGGAVTFRFTSPSYRFGRTQWQFNSEDITGATNAVLFLSDIRPSHAGEYRVIIEAPNSAGVLKQTISPPATLTVLGDITRPTLSLQRSNGSASELLLKILGATNQSYGIFRTSDFATWIPVPTQVWTNTAKSGDLTVITQVGNAEFLRVQHRGNLTEVCTENLRQIHFAKELVRVAYHRVPGAAMITDDVKEFLGELPQCPELGTYTYNAFDTPPTCSLVVFGHIIP